MTDFHRRFLPVLLLCTAGLPTLACTSAAPPPGPTAPKAPVHTGPSETDPVEGSSLPDDEDDDEIDESVEPPLQYR